MTLALSCARLDCRVIVGSVGSVWLGGTAAVAPGLKTIMGLELLLLLLLPLLPAGIKSGFQLLGGAGPAKALLIDLFLLSSC